MAEDDGDLSVPVFFSAEEIMHVHLAMTTYRKVIIEKFAGSETREHAIEVISRIIEELKERNAQLFVEQEIQKQTKKRNCSE